MENRYISQNTDIVERKNLTNSIKILLFQVSGGRKKTTCHCWVIISFSADTTLALHFPIHSISFQHFINSYLTYKVFLFLNCFNFWYLEIEKKNSLHVQNFFFEKKFGLSISHNFQFHTEGNLCLDNKKTVPEQ